MKKVVSMICVLGIISLMLSGCGRSGHDGGVIYDGVPEGTCADESIISQLKNDDSPEFILNRRYYSLPVSVGEFTKYGGGWELTMDEYDAQEVILQPNERIDATLTSQTMDEYSISITLANNSEQPLDAKECDVVSVRVYVAEGEMEPNYFVTKYGITTATSAKTVKAQLKDIDGFKESSVGYTLTSDGDDGPRDILFFSDNNGYTSIRISSAEDWVYKLYKPLEEKAKEQAENIAAYKKEVEEKCNQNYDEIVNNIVNSTNSLYTEPFYSGEGTIILKTTANYEGSENNLLYSGDLSIYVVEDKTGQHYCIYEGYVDSDILKLPELAEGDTISVWGYASKYTTFEDGYRVPTLTPGIVEKDGEIIYLADSLEVN